MNNIEIYSVFDLLYYSCQTYWKVAYNKPINEFTIKVSDEELSRYIYSKTCLNYLLSLGLVDEYYGELNLPSVVGITFNRLRHVTSMWKSTIDSVQFSYLNGYDEVRMSNAIDFALVFMSTRFQVEKELGISSDFVTLKGVSVKGLLMSCISYYYLNELGMLTDEFELSSKDKDELSSLLYLSVAKLKGYGGSEPILIGDRLAEIKKLKLGIGDVVFLYKRNLKSDGLKIDDCSIAIIKKLEEGRLSLSVVPFVDAIENRLVTFSNLPTDLRELYGDLREFLNVTNSLKVTTLSLVDVGIGYMFVGSGEYKEEYILSPIESIYPTVMHVFIDNGNLIQYSFSVQEAVFYMLHQYNIKFNDKRYRERYRGDFDLVYDLCLTSKEILRGVYNVNI